MKRRLSFTIIEFLMVIAIISILAAALLLAINAAREAARRTQCANNLRQLGVAASAYHTIHGCLPPGWAGPITFDKVDSGLDDFQYVGALAYLLPHMEQQPLFEQINVELDVDQVGPHWRTDDNTTKAAMTNMKVLICPSDTPVRDTTHVVVAFTTYGYSHGPYRGKPGL